MKPTRRAWIGASLAAGVLAGLALAGCSRPAGGTMKVPASQHVSRVEGRTLIDESYNCKISVPNAKWTVEPQYEKQGDAISLVQCYRAEYNAMVGLAVTTYAQPTLAAFAGVGSYNPTDSRFTYVAGKPCFYATKPMPMKGFTFNSVGYKFVSEKRGYVITVVYPAQFTHHEALQQELDAVLNSFDFLRPDTEIAAGPETKLAASGRKLSRVALLDVVDLAAGKPTGPTKTLTAPLQDACARSGRFELLERRDLAAIAKEHDLQASGMISGGSAVKTGKLLGARYLISGNLGAIGASWVLYVQVTDAQTGKIVATASMRCRKGSDEQLLNLIRPLVAKLVARI